MKSTALEVKSCKSARPLNENTHFLESKIVNQLRHSLENTLFEAKSSESLASFKKLFSAGQFASHLEFPNVMGQVWADKPEVDQKFPGLMLFVY